MKLKFLFVLVGLGSAAAAHSQPSQMFVCTDAEGVRTYQNQDGGENCLPLNLNPITVVPGTQVSKTNPQPGVDKSSAGKRSTPVPEEYSLAADKLKIIQEELRLEQGKLQALKEEYNEGNPERQGSEKNYQRYLDRKARIENDMRLTQDNINILQREMDTLLP